MLRDIIRYLMPRPRLRRVPRTISAKYQRTDITREQAIILSAGLARDPEHAQSVLNDLRKKYGAEMWRYVDKRLYQPTSTPFKVRWLRTLQFILGEDDLPKIIRRKRPDPRLIYKIQIGDQDA